MTVAAFIPNLWSSRFTSRLRESLVWGDRCNRNYESEVSSSGNLVKIPTPTTSLTISDYAVGSNITAAQTTTGSTTDLSINKQKYYHFLVDDVDRMQEKPDQMSDAMGEAAFKMAKQVDTDVMTEFNTAFNATRRIAQQTQHPEVTDKTFGENFLRNLGKATTTMDRANIPAQDRWIVVPPEIMEGLSNYFILSNPAGVFLPATSESTLRNGFRGRLANFNLIVANSVPAATAIATKAAFRCFIGQGREAVTFATQIRESIAYRPELRFGDAVKGLMVYGTKAVLPERLYTLAVQKKA